MQRPSRPSAASTPWARIAFLVESAAAVIALLLPITPSKTGSIWSPATLIWPEPSYPQEVLMWFALTNALLLIAGTAAWVAMKARP